MSTTVVCQVQTGLLEVDIRTPLAAVSLTCAFLCLVTYVAQLTVNNRIQFSIFRMNLLLHFLSTYGENMCS